MAAIIAPLAAIQSNLRPLNIVRDLPAVADLVEQCFAETMDAEGRDYIQQMRRAGQDNTFLRWASRTVESVSMPLSGYVWEENREIIGNASLIPYYQAGRKYYLIANVAVHPNHRRKGIGRALTVAAMEHSYRRKANETWLHVRSDNPGAITLYQNLGFSEQFRRTTWDALPFQGSMEALAGISITRRSSLDWPIQQEWFNRAYPKDLTWYQPMPWMHLKPGFIPAFIRFLSDVYFYHWVARVNEQAVAMVACQSMPGHSNHLWLAIPEQENEEILSRLLLHVRRHASRERSVLEFPAGKGVAGLQAAGFTERRTLLWMKLSDTWNERVRTSS